MTLVIHTSKSVEWYTPKVVVDAANFTFSGRIDPASCGLANTVVGANTFFCKADDGLNLKWWGNVFLNPPGGAVDGKSSAKRWWWKLVKEYLSGRVKQCS